MATDTVTPVVVNPAPSETVAFDNESYAVVLETVTTRDDKGNETTETNPKVYPDDTAKELEKNGKGQVAFSQTFAIPKALKIEGITQIIPDADEACAMFNRGLKVKLQNRLRSMLTARDKDGNLEFEPVEGAFDLSAEAKDPTQKRGASPLEKVMKVLEKIPEEQRAAVLAALTAQAQQG